MTGTGLQTVLTQCHGRPITLCKERRIATLWAGYGSVSEVEAVVDNHPQGPEHHRLVVKKVKPPFAAGPGHKRKIRSYEVESTFYETLANAVIEESGCALPKPWLVSHDSPSSFLLVLSDLRLDYPVQAESLNDAQTMSALDWLARFHAHFWEQESVQGMWEQGTYWYLDTRKDEFQRIGPDWAELKEVAGVLDMRLKGGTPDGGVSHRHRTLLHGDFKSENLLFSEDHKSCAVYDFQYCGSGYGARDVAYLLCSSVDEAVLQSREQTFLNHYFKSLQMYLKKFGRKADGYDFDVFCRHYALSLLDYMRFMAGWGFWGNVSWAQAKCKDLLKEVSSLAQ